MEFYDRRPNAKSIISPLSSEIWRLNGEVIMYLDYGKKQYPCGSRIGADMVYTGLPEKFPAPVDGPVRLCRDDGFVLREDDPAGYLRQTFAGGVLTLTNMPEPAAEAPEEVPAEQPPSEMERLRADVDYIAAMTGVTL